MQYRKERKERKGKERVDLYSSRFFALFAFFVVRNLSAYANSSHTRSHTGEHGWVND
jgi:hypothetical protein